MKKMHRSMILAVLIFCCILPLAACSAGISGDEAKAHINEFLAAVAAEEYDKAESLLHPDLDADLEVFFRDIVEKNDLDFQKGITVEGYSAFSSAVYSSRVGGATYELTTETLVGDEPIRFVIEIIRNKNGYGIVSLDIRTVD